MLRALVAALLLANLAYWAWSAGALDGLGLGPTQERDPARLQLQVRPETVRVVPGPAAEAAPRAVAASAVPAAGASAGLCLETAPMAAAALEVAERLLAAAALPEGLWQRASQDSAAQYAVVLGPFNSAESLKKKAEEIGRLRIGTESLELPAEAGAANGPTVLALGRYDGRNAADAGLAAFTQRGVRTARVAMLKAAASETRLRIASASAAQAEQVQALKDPVLGAGFAPCAPGPAAASR